MSAGDATQRRAVVPREVPSEPADSPRKDQRAVANLRPDAALAHGAYSPEKVAPIRDRHLDALRERFPSADVTILGLQATRLAQLELVGAWLDSRGVLRNRRTGAVFAAAEFWSKIASAFERQHERLEAQERERATPNPAQALARIVAHNDGAEP